MNNTSIHTPLLDHMIVHKTIMMTIALPVSADPGVCCNQPNFCLCSSLLLGREKADGHC